MKPRFGVAAIGVALVLVGCVPPNANEAPILPSIEAPRPIAAGSAPPDEAPVEPPPVVEHPGQKPDQPAIWAPGRWSWNVQRGTFLWVRGVWALLETSFEPPPPRAEHPPAPPSPTMFWAPGAWIYRGKDFLWIGGHWEKTRPGFVYKGAEWVEDKKRYRFVEATWQKE